MIGVLDFNNSSHNYPFKNSDRTLITFFWSSPDEYLWLPEKMWPTGGWLDQRAAILDLITAAKVSNLDADIVVRLHPNLAFKDRLDQEVARSIACIPEVTVIDFEDSTSSYDLLSASDIVFSCCSTVSIEACAYHKPSVLMGRVFLKTFPFNQDTQPDEIDRVFSLSTLRVNIY